MRDQLLFAASALARIVLVIAAFAIAVGSIALSSVRGFCPELEEQALAMPAAPAATVPLATIVEEPTLEPPAEPVAPTEGDQPPAGTGEEAPADGGGACPGGAPRCLPPLLSSILIIGEPTCHDQAGSELRGILVPAFVGSTVLLAAAWWMRPSRLHGSSEDERVDAPRRTH